VKQDELNSDSEFIVIIGLWGKLISYLKLNKRQFWKWKGVCKAYRNPVSESDVGHASFENKRKACEAQVVSTTRSGLRCMEFWVTKS
jgi:hypothetical protein